ncbi:MAG: hypothetical protein K5770_13845, partial [Lachnospiraceae bacterium]|nr:hypothetical protein [Lachnospiraceae bacterium]
GKYGPFCTTKDCRMRFGKAMGADLTEEQVRDLLEGKRILLKGLTGKSGKPYDAYLTPKGIRGFSYTDKNGKEVSEYQYDYEMDFPKKAGGTYGTDK